MVAHVALTHVSLCGLQPLGFIRGGKGVWHYVGYMMVWGVAGPVDRDERCRALGPPWFKANTREAANFRAKRCGARTAPLDEPRLSSELWAVFRSCLLQ